MKSLIIIYISKWQYILLHLFFLFFLFVCLFVFCLNNYIQREPIAEMRGGGGCAGR